MDKIPILKISHTIELIWKYWKTIIALFYLEFLSKNFHSNNVLTLLGKYSSINIIVLVCSKSNKHHQFRFYIIDEEYWKIYTHLRTPPQKSDQIKINNRIIYECGRHSLHTFKTTTLLQFTSKWPITIICRYCCCVSEQNINSFLGS